MNEEYEPHSWLRELYDLVEAGMFAMVFIVLLFTFVARLAGVDGDSMTPTLHDQDRLLISRLGYEPRPGDIVVITKPNRRDEPLVKRVVATGGQTVYIDFGTGLVLVDNVEQEGFGPTNLQYDMQFPQTVPQGHVFVLGDNRNNSWDSRDAGLGMIDERYILGKVLYRVWPYEDMGRPE